LHLFLSFCIYSFHRLHYSNLSVSRASESAENAYDPSLFGKFAVELATEKFLGRHLKDLRLQRLSFLNESDLERLLLVFEELLQDEDERELSNVIVCFCFLILEICVLFVYLLY
jgi:hypothetical protein